MPVVPIISLTDTRRNQRRRADQVRHRYPHITRHEKCHLYMTEEFADIPLFMEQMAESIRKTTAMLDKAQTSAFFQRMLSVHRVYVAGAGRSGLIARAFAMRLLHLGFDVYVVGETVTPALQRGDTLVIFSGSGETHSMAT